MTEIKPAPEAQQFTNPSLSQSHQSTFATAPQIPNEPSPFSQSASYQEPQVSLPNQHHRGGILPYLLGAVIAGLFLLMIFQQTQIDRLSKELAIISDNVNATDVRSRLDAEDAKIREINTRLVYLDSKISATDEKAQLAVNTLKAQQENDIFGNVMKNIRHTLGMQ